MTDKTTYKIIKDCFYGKAGEILEVDWDAYDGATWCNLSDNTTGQPFGKTACIKEIKTKLKIQKIWDGEKIVERHKDTKRALGYAKSLVAFQEVGAGPVRNLSLVRQTARNIIELCEDETGIRLNTYPFDFVKENK